MDHWPHSPPHMVFSAGTYMVTSSVLHKRKLFDTPEKLDYLESELLAIMAMFEWKLQAWAVFQNHYHFVGIAPPEPQIATAMNRLHGRTSKGLNDMDGVRGRKVWFQYRDTALTYQKSYLARLSYVHQNPVKHGLVKAPEDYKWCSAKWFSESATRAQYNTMMSLPIDSVNVD